jgi:membrane protein DedA with SNARE-associated domain
MAIHEHLRLLIAAYGYWVVAGTVGLEGMGLPLPGETALVLAAIYAGMTDELSIFYVVVAATAGAILGDNLGYWIGRDLGRRILRRYGRYLMLTESRLQLGQYLFVRHGGKVVFFARFFTVLRALGAFLAGVNHMRWYRFVVFNGLGATAWAATFGLGAYVLGDRIQHVLGPLGILTLALLVLLVAALLLGLRRREAAWRLAAQSVYKALPPSARNS